MPDGHREGEPRTSSKDETEHIQLILRRDAINDLTKKVLLTVTGNSGNPTFFPCVQALSSDSTPQQNPALAQPVLLAAAATHNRRFL